jgi:hypothetical protein
MREGLRKDLSVRSVTPALHDRHIPNTETIGARRRQGNDRVKGLEGKAKKVLIFSAYWIR